MQKQTFQAPLIGKQNYKKVHAAALKSLKFKLIQGLLRLSI